MSEQNIRPAQLMTRALASAGMKVTGLVFAGSGTPNRAEMVGFLSEVLGLTAGAVGGVEADLFTLPDGSTFAVSSPHGMGLTDRSIGFSVEDLDVAVEELRAAGISVGDLGENDDQRYVHFTAPDGHLYELVQFRDTERRPSV
jgi:catechol 2,3-dioxygenase-like lactoylglutathione lyase family enzyme